MRQLPDDRALILAATHFEHEKKRALAPEQLLSYTQNGSLYSTVKRGIMLRTNRLQ